MTKNKDVMIKIGDRVKFINDTSVGIVKSIKGAVASVEVEEGFVVPSMIDELVVVAEVDELKAIERIGVGDERPGVKRKAERKEIKDEKTKKQAAYARYGKVSLVADEEEEEPVDLYTIRERYLRNMAAVNDKQIALDAARNLVNDPSVFEESETTGTEDDYRFEEKGSDSAKSKMKTVDPDHLDEAMGVEIPKMREQQVPQQRNTNDPEIVDLHADAILDSTVGMAPGEILSAQLSRFTIALDSAVLSGRHGKIVFIHGVGSGKLKYELQKRLGKEYPKLQYQDASFKEYGYGAIMVFY